MIHFPAKKSTRSEHKQQNGAKWKIIIIAIKPFIIQFFIFKVDAMLWRGGRGGSHCINNVCFLYEELYV